MSIYGCVCVLKQLICILLGEEPSINIPERKSMCATLLSWFCLSLSANISHGLSLLMDLQIGTVQSALLASITGLFLAVDLNPQSQSISKNWVILVQTEFHRINESNTVLECCDNENRGEPLFC